MEVKIIKKVHDSDSDHFSESDGFPGSHDLFSNNDFSSLVSNLRDTRCIVYLINMYWVLYQVKRAYLAPSDSHFKSFFDAHQAIFKKKNDQKEHECLFMMRYLVTHSTGGREWQCWIIHSHDVEAFEKEMSRSRKKMTRRFIGTMMNFLQPVFELDSIPGQISWTINGIVVETEDVCWRTITKEQVNDKFSALESTLPPGTNCLLKIVTAQ